MIKFRGSYFEPRGSNKKHRILDDLDMVFDMLKVKCPAHVARQLGVPSTSLLYLIDKYFSEAEKSQIAWGRSRHRNRNNRNGQ